MTRPLWLLALSFFATVMFGASPPQPTQAGLIYGNSGNDPLKMDFYAGKGVGARPVAIVIENNSTAHQSTAASFVPAGYHIFAIGNPSAQQHPVETVERAIRFVRFHARDWNADSTKIALIGTSEGAYLSMMVGLLSPSGIMGSDDSIDRESARVQAVVAALQGDSGRATLDRLLEQKAEEAALAQSSPAYINPEAPPFLLIYGSEDPASTQLPDSLRKAGMHCDVIHSAPSTWQQPAIDWLNKTLASHSPI